jgi:membrane protein DedA with SNARE-associated domain
MAVLLARFSTSVRLFAAILAGSGQIGYWRFVALDSVGTVIYATLWIVLGTLFGAAVLERTGPFTRVLLLLVPTALFGVLAYRLARRRRYGPASHDLLSAR